MFPPPSLPCNVVPLFELPLENKKHPNFERRGHGRGVDSYVSEVTLFEYNVSTILSPIAVLTVSKKHLHQHNIFDHFSMSIPSFSRFIHGITAVSFKFRYQQLPCNFSARVPVLPEAWPLLLILEQSRLDVVVQRLLS